MLALVWRDRQQRFTAGEREPANGIQSHEKIERTIPGANVIDPANSNRNNRITRYCKCVKKNICLPLHGSEAGNNHIDSSKANKPDKKCKEKS